MNRAIKLVAIVLVFLQKLAFAQEATPGLPNELDKMFVPDKNSIFYSGPGAASSGNSSSPIEIKNTITFNPTLLIRRSVGLFYEHWFSEKFSVKGGLGFCYNVDRIQAITYSMGIAQQAFSPARSSTVSIAKIMEDGVFEGPRLYSSVSLRLHWDSFFGGDWNPFLEANSQQHSNTLKMPSENVNYYNYYDHSGLIIVNEPVVHVRTFSLNLIYGSQFVTSGKVKTTHEFFFGMGLKNASYEVFRSSSQTLKDPELIGDPIKIQVQEKTLERENILIPSLLMGYVFGFGF
jgi:hypothetical protein